MTKAFKNDFTAVRPSKEAKALIQRAGIKGMPIVRFKDARKAGALRGMYIKQGGFALFGLMWTLTHLQKTSPLIATITDHDVKIKTVKALFNTSKRVFQTSDSNH